MNIQMQAIRLSLSLVLNNVLLSLVLFNIYCLSSYTVIIPPGVHCSAPAAQYTLLVEAAKQIVEVLSIVQYLFLLSDENKDLWYVPVIGTENRN